MPSRKRTEKRTNRLPVLPYALAMKAYAFARKPFDYAMDQLRFLNLETPRQDVASHSLYWEILGGMYDDYKYEARKLSRDFCFSRAQLAVLGLDPFYTWIMEDENPSASHASAFTQGIIDEMQHFRMRQIVSVLLRLQETPEAIEEELQRIGFSNWRVEHIAFYNRFFWNIAPMAYEDWLTYLHIANPYNNERTDDEGIKWHANPHFTYLKDMVTMTSAEALRFKCGLPLATSLSEMDKDLQLNLGLMIKEAMRSGDCKNTARLLSPYTRMAALANTDRSDPLDMELRETMDQLRIIATPTQARLLGANMKELGYIEPLDMVEGEISDPRDTRPGPTYDPTLWGNRGIGESSP
jgi:hypothetical protein